MKKFTLEELAKHHEATGSKVSEYVAASDYDAIKAERDALAAMVVSLKEQNKKLADYCKALSQPKLSSAGAINLSGGAA